MEAIHVKNVVKDYGSTRALNGVSVTILPGELFFLLGASGCGKSTLLRCIAGLEVPTSGQIYFGDTDVTTLAPHKREAAMVFQSYALWPHLTVAENIGFGLVEKKVPKNEIKERVEEALQLVKLSGYGDRSIDAMSGGQQQRVALARALVVKPRCLLLDEPLSNLDAQLRIEMRQEIRRIVKENGLTAIYVTHDQEEALAMADRMAILAGGVIEQLDKPEEIYRNPITSYVAGFIGETNLLDGSVISQQENHVRIHVGVDLDGRITAPLSGQKIKASIRPESIRVKNGGTGIAATIADRVYLGQCIQYWLSSPAGKLQAVELNPHHIYNIGDQVSLEIDPTDVVVLSK